jgi:Zn-dependent protease with chaperone function
MNQPVTFQQLFEKYAKRERERSIVSVVMGTLSTAGVVLAVIRLRELKADRRAAALLAARNASDGADTS